MRVRLADIGQQVRVEGPVARFGKSEVGAFASRFVEMIAADRADRLLIAIAELGALTRASDGAFWINGFDGTHQQGAEITIAKSQPFAVRLRRTAATGVPLYVSWESGVLVVSWRFEEAVRNLAAPLPDREACRIYVENGPALTRGQVIKGVSMLWPGEAIELADSTLRFFPASDMDVVMPSVLSTDARATDALRDTIVAAMRPCLAVARTPLVEVSGGLDSACVALAARQCRDDIHSYGLIHAGAVGEQQRARRDELIALLGLRDLEFQSDLPPQFAALEIPEAQVTPFDDNHRMPCALAVDQHPDGPIDLIMSGVGGDELAMERTYRRQEWELPGIASASSLTVAAGRADMFMRRGIWTLNPLTAAPVVDLCRALPVKMRNARMINVLMLARAGLSDGFLFPRYAEGYGHGMQREAALIDFDALLADSIVADHRAYDFSGLLDQARKASNGGFSYELVMALFWLMKLEKVLRCYIH